MAGELEFAEAKARVFDWLGIHLRPARIIATWANQHENHIRIVRLDDGSEFDAKSIMDLVVMAAPCGCDLAVRVTGPNAEAVARQLKWLLEHPMAGMECALSAFRLLEGMGVRDGRELADALVRLCGRSMVEFPDGPLGLSRWDEARVAAALACFVRAVGSLSDSEVDTFEKSLVVFMSERLGGPRG